MSKDKAKGIEGLVRAIKHHLGEHKLSTIYTVFSIGAINQEEFHENLKYRGRMLETDMRTLNNAVAQVVNIAKEKGYSDIVKILEENEYEHGHEWPDSE